MKKKNPNCFFRIFVLFLALGVFVNTQAQASVYDLNNKESGVEFSAKSTLHGFKGHAHQIKGWVNYDPQTGTVVLPITIEIPTAQIETGHAARDKAMQRMFESESYPVLIWTAKQMNCTPLSSRGLAACDAQGRLRIRNVERDLSFVVRLSGSPEKLSAEGHFEISLKDYALKPPSVIGLIRVFDTIKVELHTAWTKSVGEAV